MTAVSLIRIIFCTLVFWLSWLVLRSCWRHLPRRPAQAWYQASYEQAIQDSPAEQEEDIYEEALAYLLDEAELLAMELVEGETQ